MAEEYQQTIATAQGDGKVVGEDVVDLKGKEDDQKVDVQDVQAMTKVGEGEKLGCDTSSSSDSKSASDSGSDSVSSKSNSVSSKSNSDSNSNSGSNSGTSTLKEKKRIKRRVHKVKLSKKLAEKGEEKIGMVTEMDVNKDGAEGTKLLEEGDDKLHDKLQCDSSDSGSKSGSDSNSKTGSDSGSKSASFKGVEMEVIVEKLEEPVKMEGSLEEKKSFLKKLMEKLPSYHKKPINKGGDVEGEVQGIKENGKLEKIMGNLPVYHKNNEDEIVDAN